MTLRRPACAALAALLAAIVTPAAGQEDNRRLVKSGADGRFETLQETTVSLRGHPPAQVASFRTKLDGLFALMAATPAVSAPAYPACSRLESWLQRNDIEPMLMGTVSVHTPEVVTPGRCEKNTEMGVEIALNSLSPILPSAHVSAPEGKPRDWFVLPIKRQGPDFMELQGDAIILFEPRSGPFKPVSTERYARHQLNELTAGGESDGGPIGELYRQRLSSWTLAQRQAPACSKDPNLSPDKLENIVIDAEADCPPERVVVELDDRYFDRRRPDVIQLIALNNPPRHSIESDRSWDLRASVWASIDHARMKAMVGR
ncbi:MAG: hypothetical protein KBC34_14560 [Phenylobacterium sp.]|nr:hypothetical protein [Phenylobacterium sp.]